jgi:hypothetical protein
MQMCICMQRACGKPPPRSTPYCAVLECVFSRCAQCRTVTTTYAPLHWQHCTRRPGCRVHTAPAVFSVAAPSSTVILYVSDSCPMCRRVNCRACAGLTRVRYRCVASFARAGRTSAIVIVSHCRLTSPPTHTNNGNNETIRKNTTRPREDGGRRGGRRAVRAKTSTFGPGY